MNIFTTLFLQNFSKIFPKRTILKKILGGACPEHPNKRVALPRDAWSFAPCKYTHFSKKCFEPPPTKSSIRHCIQANFEINRPIRYQITAQRKHFHTRQTDGQTSLTIIRISLFRQNRNIISRRQS